MSHSPFYPSYSVVKKGLQGMPTIAKIWKEPRCPSADEWIKKM